MLGGRIHCGDGKLQLETRKSEINIRTVVNLPGGSGKNVKVAVVCEDSKTQIAKDTGADIVGGDDFIEKIKSGELNFEKLICTPSMMIKLSKLGKVLGPKGLMPNPKSGTVTNDIAKAIKELKAGKLDARVEKNGILQSSIGKTSFSEEELKENFETLRSALMSAKPNSFKGKYLNSISISSTLGPGIKIGTE